MNILVSYYSKFGNTQKVAESIANTLSSAGIVRTLSVDQLSSAALKEIDLLVIGSPTHYQNLPEDVRAILDALPAKALANKFVAAFDTSIKMWKPIMLLTAAHRLNPILRKLGAKRLISPETFLIETDFLMYGAEELRHDKLCDGELEHAAEWAEMILQAMVPERVPMTV